MSVIQGPVSVTPCQTLSVTIRNFCIAVRTLDCAGWPPPSASGSRSRPTSVGTKTPCSSCAITQPRGGGESTTGADRMLTTAASRVVAHLRLAVHQQHGGALPVRHRLHAGPRRPGRREERVAQALRGMCGAGGFEHVPAGEAGRNTPLLASRQAEERESTTGADGMVRSSQKRR